MTLPLLGPMSLRGFANPWFFLLILAILALIGIYIVVQLARQKRVLRFANMELLESVAPKRPTRWRHLPAILLILSLLLLTVAMAGPTNDVRIPRNRAVVMLVIDVSQSMRATDVSPNRLAAAQEASKQFADELTPGINLGLIAFAGTATVLVSPTTNREATKNAIDKLQLADRTATGEGIFTALQAIATVGAVIGGGDEPPPARIVLVSDGRENQGKAVAGAQAAKDSGVPIYYSPLALTFPQEVIVEQLLLPTEIKFGEPFYAKVVVTSVKETGGRLGFITPMTHNFCESCNRVRLTCTGTLYMCLGQEDAADLRGPLRASEGNELLHAAIDAAILRKPKGHDFIIDRRHQRPALARHMSVTGG